MDNNYKVGFSLFSFITLVSLIILYFVNFQHNISLKEGTSCNDGKAYTVNDKYHDGLCSGNILDGTSCNDKNLETINDTYKNGVCLGINVQNFPCDDKNPLTKDDIYHNGVCSGMIPDGTICNDGRKDTKNDKYFNGICSGSKLNIWKEPIIKKENPIDEGTFLFVFMMLIFLVVLFLMFSSYKEDTRYR